jgi:hypothetical protein
MVGFDSAGEFGEHSNSRFLVKSPLNQARHVVYHSHNAGILYPHWAYNAQRTK